MSLLNVLILGNGGREHALSWKLSQSSSVSKVFVAPGNGGTATLNDKVVNVPYLSTSISDFEGLKTFALKNEVGLVIPGPEQPLVDGITDVFQKIGIPVFGPSFKAAVFEGSKTFSKDFMSRHNIPTAKYANFNDYKKAKIYLDSVDYRVVLKADGIAGGKGVLIPSNKEEAYASLDLIMVERQFGSAGDSVVIEEFLEGDEISILTISDGYSYFNLPPAQDHKRIGENDTGLNTGGMGAYAPAPVATPQLLDDINNKIIKPSIDGMRRDGLPFVGLLFTGIIITKDGPKVLEYNVRFGDPETQTLLPLLSEDTDLAQIFLAAAEHRLDSVDIKLKENCFSTTVVLAAGGYPECFDKDDEITINNSSLPDNTYIFHAGTKITDDKVVTAGGRVIAVSAVASTLKESINKAYQGIECIQFRNSYFRRDIAHRAFKTISHTASNESITYSKAGVSVHNGNMLVERIKSKVKSTRRPGAESDIGGFGGLFDLKASGYNMDDTLLVAATDGVGTKLMIAQETNIHDTVGIDLVAMNVNDLIVQGAEPLLFLDYFATGMLDIDVASKFISGVADGCIQAGCALVGGETSEMPGMYSAGHYDTNGTAVGAVTKSKLLPKTSEMAPGDILLGLSSSGIHSNGYSLVRKIVEHVGLSWNSPCPWKTSKTLGEEVLVPTKIYVQQLLPSIKKNLLLGLAHITGGGLVENVPRAIPSNLQAKIDISNWKIPPVFEWLGKAGNVPIDDILKTFNMGIGMVIIVKKENVPAVRDLLQKAGEIVYDLGTLVERLPNEPGCVIVNAMNLY